jgi:hypothetical protein
MRRAGFIGWLIGWLLIFVFVGLSVGLLIGLLFVCPGFRAHRAAGRGKKCVVVYCIVLIAQGMYAFMHAATV